MTATLINASAAYVIQQAISLGVCEFCLCPGARNANLSACLISEDKLKIHYWVDERSAAFFALSRIKATGLPVAVVTTSGTAAGELLPAIMEAHYVGLPLLAITADRPRRFRRTGAPQTAEQVGLYREYARVAWDIEGGECFDPNEWDLAGPAHLNVCFEEPDSADLEKANYYDFERKYWPKALERASIEDEQNKFAAFLKRKSYPLLIVSTLKKEDQAAVARFLEKLEAPVYLEAPSGLREIESLRNKNLLLSDSFWKFSKEASYPIDSVVRIGGVPTLRLWRDLEDKKDELEVFSLNDVPFSGLSWAGIVPVDIARFCDTFPDPLSLPKYPFQRWKELDKKTYAEVTAMFGEIPAAEPSLLYALSKIIPNHSLVYLGNSLPIREWDLSADQEYKHFSIWANRGLNGIDGQVASFLGLCRPGRQNWAIVGDLTAFYDLGGLWLLKDMPGISLNLVIINNDGGKIFRRYPREFLNSHGLNFEGLAKLWGLKYHKWTSIPQDFDAQGCNLIEILPDNESSELFWKEMKKIC